MSKKILVIDDEEVIRLTFSRALESTGYQVDTAESGEIAIEMAKRTKYNLIYLDLKMPGMNGVETLRELHQIDKDVPVYIVTAFHNEFFDQLKSLEQEGIEYELMKKPIGGPDLIAVTKGVLEGGVVIEGGE